MSVMGIRCSNRDFTWVILTGSKTQPHIQELNSLGFPKNYSKPRSLLWFVQEIEQLIQRHKVQKIVMKGFEGRTRGKTYEERVEYESAVYIAGAKNGLNSISKKVKSTIAKDLGLKGRGHYLQTALDTSVIADYDAKTEKEREAILSAWSWLD